MINVYEKEHVVCIEAMLEETRSKIFVYLVDGMLIDTGAEKMQKQLHEVLNDYSFDQVVLTHHHEDHTGNAACIQQQRQLPVFIHPLGLDIVEQEGNYPKYRQLTWGNRSAFQAQPLYGQISSRNMQWQVIHTPGHAGDHIALFHAESGRLFSGDLFVSPKTRVIMKDESILLIVASLRKLLALPFESVFCSHAGYLENGRALLEEKVRFLETLQKEIVELYEKGNNACEINRQLFPKTYPLVTISGGEWDSIHIVTSILKDYEVKRIRHLSPRATTLGVVRKSQSILLEQQFVRHSAGNGPFYRPIGGSIELGETSGDALKREFQEEISADIDIERYLGVLENIYTMNQQTYHEISLVHEVALRDPGLYAEEKFDVIEQGKKTQAKWVSIEELLLEKTVLYPIGLLDLLLNSRQAIESNPK